MSANPRRVALVTGASRGMGAGVAEALAHEGLEVALLARNEETLKATAERIAEATGRAPRVVVADVTEEGVAERAVAEVLDTWGRIDVLVNNAGGPPMGGFDEHDLDAFDAAYRLSLRSVIAFTKAAVPAMQKNGYGRILSITSFLAKEPTPAMVLSGTFRAGVSAFTKSLSTQLVKEGITINTICPSAVFTDRARNMVQAMADRQGLGFEEALEKSTQALPIQRYATMKEFVASACFLLSEPAAYITGVSLVVDGGLTKSVF